ncbi:hypothetical protein BGZ49_004056 [Haplosporangium sp. Z 27]|nr:hypothetical protein BGZ49_004056 [Haplosporangium sp. Z 27]
MLHIAPVSKPKKFLNEEMPFTPGTMNFNLMSPEQLNLVTYQQTLKTIIHVLANSSSSKRSNNNNQQSTVTTGITQVLLGSGGAFILDTSVTVPGFSSSSTGTSNDNPTSLTSSQNYPLSFVATSQIAASQISSLLDPTLAATASTGANAGVRPVQYFIRLPLNPLTHGIQCQLSARRLCSKHVMLLDRILRHLCDASPSTFMLGYSDGISGIDAGTEVVYSGENHNNQRLHSTATTTTSTTLDRSIAAARDGGHVGGHVGHVDHSNLDNVTAIEIAASTEKNVKDLNSDIEMVVESTAISTSSLPSNLQNQHNSVKKSQPNQIESFSLDVNQGILNYDFGLQEDINQIADVHAMVEIDELHDMLWVN